MDPLTVFIHLLSFAAPALVVATLVALGGRLLLPAPRALVPWWVQLALNAMVGLAVLAFGLWHFGVDGKMATYAALVVAMAACQWVGSAAWRP